MADALRKRNGSANRFISLQPMSIESKPEDSELAAMTMKITVSLLCGPVCFSRGSFKRRHGLRCDELFNAGFASGDARLRAGQGAGNLCQRSATLLLFSNSKRRHFYTR